jgi:hypothetical protein
MSRSRCYSTTATHTITERAEHRRRLRATAKGTVCVSSTSPSAPCENYQLDLSRRLGFLGDQEAARIESLAEQTEAVLNGLISSLRKKAADRRS